MKTMPTRPTLPSESLPYPNWSRQLALFIGFIGLVSGIRFALRLGNDAGRIPPSRLLAAQIFVALLFVVVALCLFVWFGKRRRSRIEFGYEEHNGALVIRSRGLFRTHLRQLGLAGFSHVSIIRSGRSLFNRADRIVLEFIDGRLEPVVDVPLLEPDRGAEWIADNLFVAACRMQQQPTPVSISPTTCLDEAVGESETLSHELVVEGKNLSAYEFGPLDLAEFGRSIEADGVYFIWTCTCGDPGCGGNFSGVRVDRKEDLINWYDRDIRRRFTFRLEDLRRAFGEAIARGRDLRDAKPDLTVVPDQNRELFLLPEK
jgi:hypothetical protein